MVAADAQTDASATPLSTQDAQALWQRAAYHDDAKQAVRDLLAQRPEQGITADQALLLKVMGRAPHAPGSSWTRPLLALSPRVTNSQLTHLGQALSRIRDASVVSQLIRQANDADAPPLHRRNALLLLGHQRTQTAAAYLVQQLQADATTPEQIQRRNTIVQALTTLTGRADLGPNSEAWQRWWNDHRALNQRQWHDALVKQLGRASSDLRHQRDDALRELVAAQRSIHRLSPNEKQVEQLQKLLTHPEPALRKLAIELTLKQLLDGREIQPTLVQTLRTTLTDPDTDVRRQTTLLLSDLGDEPAARVVAQRLADGTETDPQVIPAALVMLARLPQQEAVPPALNMLAVPFYSNDAAQFLADADAQGLLDESQKQTALRQLSIALQAQDTPTPGMIRLLGRIGSDAQWQHIARWIDAQDEAVRQAAAQAWADSDRSLKLLADRFDDPIVQPIFLRAATRRGEDPFTLQAMVNHQPEQPETVSAWQQAIIAMSQRMSLQIVQPLIEPMRSNPRIERETLELILASAIERGQAQDTLTPKDAQALVQLLLERAALRIDQQDYKQAESDFGAIAAYEPLADDVQRQLLLLKLQARFAQDRYESAFEHAAQLLAEHNTPEAPETRSRVIDQFLAVAHRYTEERKPEQAQQVLTRLTSLTGNGFTDSQKQQLSQLRQKIAALNSELSETPETPGTPNNPESPDAPDTPGTPGAPAAPEASDASSAASSAAATS